MQIRQNISHEERQQWMKELSLAPFDQLSKLWEAFSDKPSYKYLRATESGLVQVRGKLGNTGDRFNMGDMTMTRASVALENGLNGFAYVQGRNKQHADIGAVIDALMQSDLAPTVNELILSPLNQARIERRRTETEQTLKTKVDFFTLVRGEDE
ncbi:phosphonate C-P lyase system protein PhnG [Vibrio japonicus]|uniref:Phosphonate C-P lyase system protein PhnG n=1 Tax=Vibrio japonicus TaxID=1824638 RepID=A0ABY5LNS0_9VIBR|nr:phosphonate C-P lyase system protein PhnG [Vibrio japonicus]UUM32359.1 phosphonate C-P lyase system protein PhnG [Vibrio japonicus]